MAGQGRSPVRGDRPIVFMLLVGIPGSGKSTWAQQFLAGHPHYQVVSTDQIRAELYGDAAIQGDWRRVWQQVRHRWQQGVEQITRGHLEGVIYDATNTRRGHRRQTIAIARGLGFDHLTLVWFDVPLEVGLRRNQLRSRQVPAEVIVKMHRQLQGAPPTLAEDVNQILHFAGRENSPSFLN